MEEAKAKLIALRFFARCLLLAFALGEIGCATRPPVSQLTLVTTRQAFTSATVVAADVEGYYCHWRNILDSLSRFPWNLPMMDHALALQAVMRQYPEANVMLNASVRVRVNEFILASRHCIFVEGDLARVE